MICWDRIHIETNLVANAALKHGEQRLQRMCANELKHELRRKYDKNTCSKGKYCTNTFERKPNKNCDCNKAFTSFTFKVGNKCCNQNATKSLGTNWTGIATQILHVHVQKETAQEQRLEQRI